MRFRVARPEVIGSIPFCFLLLLGSPAAGSIAPPYEVGTWRGFRPAAISYTFDDDLPNQYSIATPMFNARGFEMTLFTVTTWVPGGSWSPVKTAAASGHEIASHSVTHPDFSTLTSAQQTNELKNSQLTINANITNQQCLTVAYPYCVEGNDAIAASYYIAARGCSGQLVPATPANFMNISSFVCGPQGSVQTPQDFNNKAESAAAARAWCVYLIHALDNESGYSPLPSATLQASLDYLSTNQNKFWVETFGNVVRYIRERNAVSVTAISNSADRIVIQVTNALNQAIYNYPITVRRPLPVNWPAAMVSQNNQPLPAQLITLNSTNFVMFDVVPNTGDVVLSKTAVPPILNSPSVSSGNLVFHLDGQAGVSYAIYASGDLKNWQPVQTNALVSTSATVALPMSEAMQFYRAVWMP
jgi:peptidoglycan-N-acetylglucosamine deacetylase